VIRWYACDPLVAPVGMDEGRFAFVVTAKLAAVRGDGGVDGAVGGDGPHRLRGPQHRADRGGWPGQPQRPAVAGGDRSRCPTTSTTCGNDHSAEMIVYLPSRTPPDCPGNGPTPPATAPR
jgi:hypothetical protein